MISIWASGPPTARDERLFRQARDHKLIHGLDHARLSEPRDSLRYLDNLRVMLEMTGWASVQALEESEVELLQIPEPIQEPAKVAFKDRYVPTVSDSALRAAVSRDKESIFQSSKFIAGIGLRCHKINKKRKNVQAVEGA
jgi:hypothetical protein